MPDYAALAAEQRRQLRSAGHYRERFTAALDSGHIFTAQAWFAMYVQAKREEMRSV